MKYLVAGNYTRFAVTLTQKSGELITPYIPTEGDVVQISLYGARRFDYPNYTQSSNVLTFEDNGCLNVGLYCLEVKITEANTHKLRCMYREQIRVVASNDDVPTDASFTDDNIELQGQFEIAASTEIVVDDELSLTSTNPVQNKVVTAALNEKIGKGLYWDYTRLTFSNAGDALDIDGTVYVGETEEIATITASIPVAGTLDAYNNPLPGVMSLADKTKLDGIEAQANRIDGISADAESGGYMVYLKNGNTTVASVGIPWAWNSQDGGLMTRTDYDRLHNSVGDSLNTEYTAGGLDIELKCGNTTLSYVSVPFADAQNDGLMSAADYAKLAGIATGATKVIVDSTFDTTSNNAISNSAVALALNAKENRVTIEAPVNSVDATQPITTLTTEIGKYYRIDVAVETLAITLPAMTDSTKIANVVLYLTGGTTPAVTIASTAPSGGTAPDVYYQDGFAIEAGKSYEVNCLWNGVAWVVAAVEIVIS